MLAAWGALPIVAVLVLMVGFGWSAVRAGVATAAGTAALALTAFRFGADPGPYGRLGGLVGVLAEAGFVTVTVIAIIGPALAVHHLQQRTGATLALRAGLGRLSPDPRAAALLIAWFFSLFMEGAAGFGTPVALAAPFLVAAGFTPVAAVAAALIGHAAGVSFGALGTPVMAQVAATGLTGRELARATVPYHSLLGWVLTAAVVLLVGRALPAGRPPWALGAVAAAAFFVPSWLLGTFVGPELPTLGGALLGAVAFLVVVRTVHARTAGSDRVAAEAHVEHPATSDPTGTGDLVRAGAPYLALVVLVLATRLVPPVKDALFGVVVDWQLWGSFSGSVRPLYHPGLLLTVAFAAGALAQRASFGDVRAVVGSTNRQLVPVLVALLAMVTIARTMSQAGMTAELAAAAAGVGAAWPLVAPAVGALGTFVTGSATASNLLFTEFQASTAEALGRPVLPLLGAQGFGAAVGNIVCPHNVVAAAATVGLTGAEGQVLRRTFPVTIAYVTLGGALALWLAS